MNRPPSDWRPLYGLGSLGALLTLLTIPAQVVVFSLHQPPTTVVDWFVLYNEQPLQGLLNLDLLYAASQVALVPLLLGLLVSLWDQRALAVAGVGVMLFSITIHTTSNPSVEMLLAASDYAAAETEAQRGLALAAGETLLYRWTGTSYVLGYIQAGVGLLIVAAAMWRSSTYGSLATGSALVLGLLWLVPASFGTVGLAVSFLSLIPTILWVGSVGWRLWMLSREPLAEVIP